MMPLLALLLAAAPPAPTGDWVPFDVPQLSEAAFYDRGSVERDGDLVRFWIRWNPADEATTFHEARLFSEIDCRQRTVRRLRLAVYDGDGGLIRSDETPRPVDAIQPGYAANAIARLLCPRS